MVEYLDEHLPQKICPQALQWCWESKETTHDQINNANLCGEAGEHVLGGSMGTQSMTWLPINGDHNLTAPPPTSPHDRAGLPFES